MNHILREALKISGEFKSATFVGAVAVILHTREPRKTHDLDFAVATQIEDDEYADLGYVVDIHTRKKRTPRGYKIDVYDRRGVSGIPLNYILRKARKFSVGGRGT